MAFARKISHFQPLQVIRALDIPANQKEPVPGAWVLFKAGKKYSDDGHSGIVLGVGTSTISVLESNFRKCDITVRVISRNDPEIRGYFWQAFFAKL